MTLLDLPNSVAQSVLDAMLPGLEREHGSPSSMTRDDAGGFTLEWRRERETLRVSIAADGATSRQTVRRGRLTQRTVDLLEDVYVVNRDVPDEKFDMSVWFENYACNTVGCMMGNYCAARPNIALKLDGNGIYFGDNEGLQAAAAFLGITQESSEYLFAWNKYPEGPDIPKSVALARLRAFIDSDGEIPGVTDQRKPGTLSALPTAPEGTCEQPSEAEQVEFDAENVADPYDGGRIS